MKRYFKIVLGLAVAVAMTWMTAMPATAEDAVREPEPRVGASKLDPKTRGAAIRASQLIGRNIQNSQGKSVGEIKDVVLDGNNGRVRYAAVTYGGFLGVGNKMFAVPFEAFKCQADPEDGDDYVLVLDVTQEQLEGATGFDEDNWPNFADEKFTSELDERYRIDRDRPVRDRVREGARNIRERVRDRVRDRDADVDVQVDREGVDVDVEADQ